MDLFTNEFIVEVVVLICSIAFGIVLLVLGKQSPRVERMQELITKTGHIPKIVCKNDKRKK